MAYGSSTSIADHTEVGLLYYNHTANMARLQEFLLERRLKTHVRVSESLEIEDDIN